MALYSLTHFSSRELRNRTNRLRRVFESGLVVDELLQYLEAPEVCTVSAVCRYWLDGAGCEPLWRELWRRAGTSLGPFLWVSCREALLSLPFHFSAKVSSGMLLEKDGRAATVDAMLNRGSPNGWASAFAEITSPQVGGLAWNVVVEAVGHCGDVVVGVIEAPAFMKLDTISLAGCPAWSYVVVGRPSGIVGWNPNYKDFGHGTTDRMKDLNAEYGPQILAKEGAGTVVEVRLDTDARTLSFATNGKDLGVAFNLDSRFIPWVNKAESRYIPFVTCFARDTSVRLMTPHGLDKWRRLQPRCVHCGPSGREPTDFDNASRLEVQ